jgi:putative ABC transport system substrate-binding protein
MIITFATVAAGLLLIVSLTAEAQHGKIAKVGVLSPGAGREPRDDAFEQSLQGLGWRRDQNIRIEYRYAAGQQAALASLAAELVGLGVDVLVAWSPGGGLAAKRATSQVPVVFLAGGGDPVGVGLVSNLAHPGGNVTGLSSAAAVETYAKRLEFLKDAVPSLRRVAMLDISEPRTTMAKRAVMDAAKTLGLELHDVAVKAPAELAGAIRKAKDEGGQALYVWPSGLTRTFAKQISQFALANRLPSIHAFTESAALGGFLAYAPSFTEIARRGAVYTDKILRGSKPGDLPVEQPTKFDLVINLKTAKALGLTIPPSVLLRADQVLE